MEAYDLIIIGGGPAAMSAAIYAARRKLKTAIIAQSFGGQMNEGYIIENYLGPYGTPGPALVKKFVWHLKIYKKDLDIREGETVLDVNCKNGDKDVKTDKGIYQTKTLLIATGKVERKLDIPGASEFEGKGITYCATCDAPLFSGKDVAVVGAGDAGTDTVHQLLKYANKIYWLNKYEKPVGTNKALAEKLVKDKKVVYLPKSLPIEIKGDKFVSSLVYQNSQKEEISVGGVFVEIGMKPMADFVCQQLAINDRGEIKVDHKTYATSVAGVFAAGDVIDSNYKQIIIAAGQGATAALSAAEYLKNK